MSKTFLQRLRNMLSSNDSEEVSAKMPEGKQPEDANTSKDSVSAKEGSSSAEKGANTPRNDAANDEQKAFIESLNYFTQPDQSLPEDLITVEDEPIASLTNFMQQSKATEGIQLTPNMINAPQVLDATVGQGYLAGQLLVATPVIDSGCFQRAVVYVFAHHKEGAMGVIINQPLETVDIDTLVEGMPATDNDIHDDIEVYFGGPVDKHRGFVLHSTDYRSEQTLTRHNGIALTASASILEDIIVGKGPEKAYLTVGLAGWSAGQLEHEIEQNSWINVPATCELVFNTDNDLKWAQASKSLGIDMQFYSTAVGHA